MIQKKILLSFIVLLISSLSFSQTVTPGVGYEDLVIGLTYEEAVQIIGFTGEKKSFDDYVNEEVFDLDAEKLLECNLEFDFYVKYELLLTAPLGYIFYKDNKIKYIILSSYPGYYYAICEKIQTKEGLKFWSRFEDMERVYGRSHIDMKYDYLDITNYHFLDKGISFSIDRKKLRTVSIYEPQNQLFIDSYKNKL